MKLISLLVFKYIGIMNEASKKLIKKCHFLSQVQEISYLELTTLSFYFSIQNIWYQSQLIHPISGKKKKKKIKRILIPYYPPNYNPRQTTATILPGSCCNTQPKKKKNHIYLSRVSIPANKEWRACRKLSTEC